METLAISLMSFGVLGLLVSIIVLIVQAIRKKKKKPWLLTLTAFFILIIVGGVISPTTEKDVEKQKPITTTISPSEQKIQKPIVKQENTTTPKYVILDEDVYDAPIKTQVTLSVLVSGEISEAGLKNLLNQLYSSTKARKGFKYHDSPTSIFIYAYTSKERAESRGRMWIAMLHKAHAETKATININERQLAQLGAEPEERFGLSEEKRKEIWKELILIEDRAMKEAEKQYPKQWEKEIEMQGRLIDENKNKLAEKYELAPEQLEKISTEGLEKDWPFPRKSE